MKILHFTRLQRALDTHNIDLELIEMIPLMSYKNYLTFAYNCKFVISDSGTACEELPLLDVPVLVPRDYTERPQAYTSRCSIPLNLNADNFDDVWKYIEEDHTNRDTSWLGDGNTSERVIQGIEKFLQLDK